MNDMKKKKTAGRKTCCFLRRKLKFLRATDFIQQAVLHKKDGH